MPARLRRIAGGGVLRRMGRRANPRLRRYGRSKTHIKGFTAAQSRALVKFIGRNEETKYFASQLATQQLLDAAIHSPGTDILPLSPPIPQGTAEWQRTGRKVSPTKCRVDVSCTFQQTDLGTESPDITASQANAIYVVMYIVRSKNYHNWLEYNGATTPEYNFLLDNGQGAAVPFGQQVTPTSGPTFWATNTTFLQYPIETSHYTLVRKKVVKLIRNQGFVRSAVSGEAPNLSQSYWRGSFSYKLPKLLYDDTERGPTGAYPTNSNLMIMFGYAFADNLWSQDQVPGTSQASLPLLNISVRNHVWYKDA